MDFACWWSCFGKGLRLQPAQQACLRTIVVVMNSLFDIKTLEGSIASLILTFGGFIIHVYRVCKMDFLGVKMGEVTFLGDQEQAEVS